MNKKDELKSLLSDAGEIVDGINSHDLTGLCEDLERFLDKYREEDPDEEIELAVMLANQMEDLAAEIDASLSVCSSLWEHILND